MKKPVISHLITMGGILASLTVIFQLAPVYLPAAGMLISPLATVPVFFAALFSNSLGIAVLFSSALIVFMISPEECVILLLATGPLGVALGSTFKNNRIFSILMSSMVLFSGITLLTYLVGIPAFGDLTGSMTVHRVVLLFFVFSILYSAFFSWFLKFLLKKLLKTNLSNFYSNF